MPGETGLPVLRRSSCHVRICTGTELDNLTNLGLLNKILLMKSLAVGEFKTHFSEIMEQVKSGEEIIITYGRKKENIAVVVPYESYEKKNKIKLGSLSNKKCVIKDNFSVTPEELLGL